MPQQYKDWAARHHRTHNCSPQELTDDELREAIADIEGDLRRNDPSECPEGYYCDGEISPAEADARWNGWQSRLSALEDELNRRKHLVITPKP